jgi:hypothetical protein
VGVLSQTNRVIHCVYSQKETKSLQLIEKFMLKIPLVVFQSLVLFLELQASFEVPLVVLE